MQYKAADTVYYFPHSEIDKVRWNNCIAKADNPLIYASSFYLDGMCMHWDALVLNDYEAVMPLPWKKKFSIHYLYSPYYVAAGGVFGNAVTSDLLMRFIEAVPKKFRYWDMDLNEQNFFTNVLKVNNINFTGRTNTFLHLGCSYEKLFLNYSKLAKRKLKKAGKYNLRVDKAASANKIISLYRQHYENKFADIAQINFSSIIQFFDKQIAGNVKTYTVSFDNGEICAFYLALFDENFVYWLIGGSTDEGKNAGAFYFLTDTVIKDFAGTERVLRFEGSDIDGIAFFNLQFGGYQIKYPRLIVNRLPWPVKYLKRTD